ncbi:glycosyltransferase family 4 protein [Hansschlegelia quercus]|uniref:glycosyltransferase family 4 protein n=1 Tax=Hansschlegelia quercus TaxID=2528245 RepID=UPI0013EF4C90|nr:glycosyltransferase family 4 protein [Hansschlegelia quercus]
MIAVLPDLPKREILVVSDRYPPDIAGGAELSLHLMLREPALRKRVLVATFDRAVRKPTLRRFEGVHIIALPAPAAWPLHRLSQAKVDAMKKWPLGFKWAPFVLEAAIGLLRAPVSQVGALALWIAGSPPGGPAMDKRATAESGAPAALRAIIDRVGPKLVHADNARAIVMAAAALSDRDTPMMAVVRDHRFTRAAFDQTQNAGLAVDWKGATADRLANDALSYRQDALRRARLVVATSRHLEQTLTAVATPGTLSREALVPAPPTPPRPSLVQPHIFSVLLVGSVNPGKGQAHLFEALPQLLAIAPNVQIDVAGDGRDIAKLKELAAQHSATDQVRLHDHVSRDRLYALYAASDAVALPTLWDEPFGRAPLEAGSVGKPVVAYASGGLVETVTDGDNGFLIPTGDRDAFIGALAKLAADPELRARMGEAGRGRAVGYEPARIAEALSNLWAKAMA